MTTDASLQLVQDFVELRDAGDDAAAVELMDPAARILVPPLMPHGGTWQGRDSALACLAARTRPWSSWIETPRHAPLAAAGQRVYREVSVSATVASNGHGVSTTITEVFEVRDGAIIEIRTYVSDVAIITDAVSPG